MSDSDQLWKKDVKTYYIFRCSKCAQYLYVKHLQKTKKCLRCGRTHQIKSIKPEEIVKGITQATQRIRELQHKLALDKIEHTPDLKMDYEFVVYTSTSDLEFDSFNKSSNTSAYEESFKRLLYKISKSYKKFPKYMIQMFSEEFHIPKEELQFLEKKFIMLEILIPLDNNYYQINS